MFNKILIYCSGMSEVSLLEKLIKENVPSALMVNFCRHSDKLKQAFYGYIDADPSTFKIWGTFNPEDMKMSEDGGVTAEPTEIFDTRLSPQTKKIETYFAIGEIGELGEFLDLDSKQYKVELGWSEEYKHVLFEDEWINIDYVANDLIVRTTKMLPDIVLMRSDGFMSWNNGELYVYDDDKSKEITLLCTENNVPLIKYSVVEEEIEDPNAFLGSRFKYSLGNEEEFISELKKIEQKFKEI